MEKTYLNRLKVELANKSEEEKLEMFTEEVLLYIKVTNKENAACFLVLLLNIYLEGYSIESENWKNALHVLRSKKNVSNFIDSICKFRNRYKKTDFQENILMIEKRVCIILENMSRSFLKKKYLYLFLDILHLCEEHENSMVSKSIKPISLEKRCIWASAIVRLLNPQGRVFNPKAGSCWLSTFLPPECEYIGGTDSKNLYLIEQMFYLFNERISSVRKTDYPRDIAFDMVCRL